MHSFLQVQLWYICYDMTKYRPFMTFDPTHWYGGMGFHSLQHWNWINNVVDFDEFSTQGDNKAVKYRTAHLQWLLDNEVYTLNGMNEWQPDLRRWTPSSSARYPLRMRIPKPPIDPETCKLSIFQLTTFCKICLVMKFTLYQSFILVFHLFPKK